MSALGLKVGKIYYFSPDDLDIKVNDNVIVETARGIEFGTVVVGSGYSDEELIHPLKKVLGSDVGGFGKHQENAQKKKKPSRFVWRK